MTLCPFPPAPGPSAPVAALDKLKKSPTTYSILSTFSPIDFNCELAIRHAGKQFLNACASVRIIKLKPCRVIRNSFQASFFGADSTLE